MNLDPRTIVFINFASTLIMCIGLINIYKIYQSQVKYIKKWAFGTLLQSIGWGLFALREVIPALFSIVIANTLLMLSLSIYFNILVKYKNVKIKSFWIYIPVFIYLIAILYYTYITPNTGGRILITSIYVSAILYSNGYILIINNGIKSKTELFTGFVIITSATIILILYAIIIDSSIKPNDFILKKQLANEIMFLTYFITSVIVTFGFILMCNERYLNEQNAAKKALADASEVLKKTNNIAQIGTWEIDVLNNKVHWSDITKKIHEVPDGYEVNFQNVLNFYKEGENKIIISYTLKDAKKAATSFDFNLEIITAKGNERFIRIVGKSEFDGAKCTRIFGLFQDITESIQKSEHLIQNEIHLIEAQKISKTGNYNYDFKNSRWNCSKIIDEITGLNADKVKSIEDYVTLLAPEFEEQYIEKLWQIIKQEKNIPKNNQDFRIIRPIDGQERWISINGELLYDEYNNPIKLFGTVQDITERKRTENELKESYDEVRQLTNHLENIREQERISIAREIHDELGQQLTVLKMNILSIKKSAENVIPELQQKINQTAQQVETAIHTVKKISSELRPGILDDLGLVAVLEWHAREFQLKTKIRCTFISKCTVDNSLQNVNTNIYRIFQESLTNVARHSKATKVSSELYIEDKMLVLEIIDDGIGINNHNSTKNKSFGLLGMRERANLLQGTILIENSLIGGTFIKLKIPILC